MNHFTEEVIPLMEATLLAAGYDWQPGTSAYTNTAAVLAPGESVLVVFQCASHPETIVVSKCRNDSFIRLPALEVYRCEEELWTVRLEGTIEATVEPLKALLALS